MGGAAAFSIVAIFYAVANLASMGLELDLRETIRALRSIKLLLLTLVLSWIVGPALGLLLAKILPMAESYAIGLILFSLAPTAPALPLFVRMARGDMSFAAAIMPTAVVGAVVMMPLLAPLLIQGLTLSAWEIAKPLLLTVLLPLVIGILIQVYAPVVAKKIFPVVKKLAGISTLVLVVFTLIVHGDKLLGTLGSFAVGAQVLYILIIAAIPYYLGFGLNQAQRSSLALGVCTRNGGAMFMALTAFPNPDPRTVVMILLAVPVPAILWLIQARFFASQASGTVEGGAT